MLEMLVAVLITSMLTAAVVQSISDSSRLSSAAHNQLLAVFIANQVIDAARDTPYSTLENNNGAHQLVLISEFANPGPAIYPRPLLQDRFNFAFGDRSEVNTLTDRNCTVTETITSDLARKVTRVTVLVEWTDSSGPHTLQVLGTISQYGVHVS